MTDLTTMVEVHLKNEDDFLKVKETLTRIGVASRKDNTFRFGSFPLYIES